MGDRASKMNARTVAQKRAQLIERDGPGCVRCGTLDDLTIHHVIKRADGGSNRLPNLLLLCEPCHIKEHANDADHKGSAKVKSNTSNAMQRAMQRAFAKSGYTLDDNPWIAKLDDEA